MHVCMEMNASDAFYYKSHKRYDVVLARGSKNFEELHAEIKEISRAHNETKSKSVKTSLENVCTHFDFVLIWILNLFKLFRFILNT